jgi:hypothetical protein
MSNEIESVIKISLPIDEKPKSLGTFTAEFCQPLLLLQILYVLN